MGLPILCYFNFTIDIKMIKGRIPWLICLSMTIAAAMQDPGDTEALGEDSCGTQSLLQTEAGIKQHSNKTGSVCDAPTAINNELQQSNSNVQNWELQIQAEEQRLDQFIIDEKQKSEQA